MKTIYNISGADVWIAHTIDLYRLEKTAVQTYQINNTPHIQAAISTVCDYTVMVYYYRQILTNIESILKKKKKKIQKIQQKCWKYFSFEYLVYWKIQF